MVTNEIDYKIYDREAQYGFVTHLKVSANLLAIGYSSGTILVVDLELDNAMPDEDNKSQIVFAIVHKFSFHRTAVTCMIFDDSNT